MRYNHWLAKLFNYFFGDGGEYAVTIGQTTYYSCNRGKVLSDPQWVRHENVHKQQWRRMGWKFLPAYLWFQVRYGYDKNPLEIEARKRAKDATR